MWVDLYNGCKTSDWLVYALSLIQHRPLNNYKFAGKHKNNVKHEFKKQTYKNKSHVQLDNA